MSLSFGSTPAHADVTIIVLFLWRMFDASRVRRASVCHALEISSPSLCVNVAAGYYGSHSYVATQTQNVETFEATYSDRKLARFGFGACELPPRSLQG